MMALYAILAALTAVALAVLLVPLWKNAALPLRQRRLFAAALAVLFFGGGFGLYDVLGVPEILPLLTRRDARLVELKDALLVHSARVRSHPKDLAAWVELGQDFMETTQFDAAAGAFRRAVVLSRGNPMLVMAYASALIAAADGRVTDDAKQSLEIVLEQQPYNPEARYFMALRLMQEGRTQEAMQGMKALYHELPADSPLKKMIDAQIGRAP